MSTSDPEVATKVPVNAEDSPGTLKWTELGGAENSQHQSHSVLSSFYASH